MIRPINKPTTAFNNVGYIKHIKRGKTAKNTSNCSLNIQIGKFFMTFQISQPNLI